MVRSRPRHLHRVRPLVVCMVALTVCVPALSQSYPDKIRGYKVYKTKVTVRTPGSSNSRSDDESAEIILGKPKLADLGLTGISFDVDAQVTSSKHSGRVDFLTFSDLKVNGVTVEVEEFSSKFEFRKGERIVLPKSARVNIATLNLARAARSELLDPKKEWRLTGTVLVFGKFKKFGFSFKRVVPIVIDTMIENPIRK